MIFDAPLGFVAALMLGSLGATRCVAMCGGIVVATGTGVDPRLRLTMASQVPILLAQNAGRVFSYAIAGALAGGFGSLAAAFSVGGARSWLQVFSGVMMLGVGSFSPASFRGSRPSSVSGFPSGGGWNPSGENSCRCERRVTPSPSGWCGAGSLADSSTPRSRSPWAPGRRGAAP